MDNLEYFDLPVSGLAPKLPPKGELLQFLILQGQICESLFIAIALEFNMRAPFH